MKNGYYSLNDYCREKFGYKLYKLSLDGGMTCPNRDGTVGTEGCIFCSENGSGEFAEKHSGDIKKQLENAKKRVEKKNRGGKYIAYFQSFTNTYAPVEYLEGIFTEAISQPEIEVLSIATRPDCLGGDVIELLGRLNKIKPVWVELGLQTSNEKTAEYIGRGYENRVYIAAVENLHRENIEVITHIILGLPGETKKDMLGTVEFAAEAKTDGIKLHMLYVSKGTRLAEEYEQGKFKCFEKDEYLSLICDILKIIPPNTVIHRLTGDGDKRTLIAPMWSANKKDVLNSLNGILREKCIIQGSEK